ncbi:MAG: hypothetical protein OEL56_00610 [Nitrosopumilus sp.]|nr:hypothetical protein [Nitrosopumilus sp.]MDH3515388.1 hypothetical protein [Nitrosopumilus sp.]MDH3564311.1 hypothetical protein [Nitrosopumilus sp.]MDH5417194.1 hypothetical protein [Nitrosopumilus sp.]MDH5555019.1 hypothetical protein [Nitrosopumilus sp.]
MDFTKNLQFRIKSVIGNYRDYAILNRNLIVSIASAMFVSALFSQSIKGQTEYINATMTVIVSYAIYYLVFGILYYRDNKEKYVTGTGTIDRKKLRKDFVKIVTSVGAAEIIYLSSRWFLHYHFLSMEQEPYLASIISHVIAATLFVLAVNVGVYFTKLYKKDSKNI